MRIAIRDERPSDYPAVHELTRRAFAPMPYSEGTEHHINDALRRQGAMALSLVAEVEGTVAGHVAFAHSGPGSAEGQWSSLGPIAVEPHLQKRGIGSALIREGLARLKAAGANGCMLVGDPAYYARFGFRPAPQLAPSGEPPEYFMMLSFTGRLPAIPIAFHPIYHTAAKEH